MATLRTRFARVVVKAVGYRITGQPPTDQAYVAVAAPHTSNWDFPAMIAMAWASEVTPVFLGKREVFESPLGPLMRRLGGIPVDREKPGGLVEELVQMVESGGSIALVVPPEGTRGKGTYWRSGFHRIAREAGVPIVLTYLDAPTRSGGWGPSFAPSVDLVADMDYVRAYYRDKHGLRPSRRTEPKLRAEDVEEGASSAG